MDLEHRYPGSYKSLRVVDFSNLTYSFFDEKGKPLEHFRLRKGRWEGRKSSCYHDVKLKGVHFLDSTEESIQLAFVILQWFTACGSSGDTHYAQIFTLEGGSLTVKQWIDWDIHVDDNGPFEAFDRNKKVLTIKAAHYMPGDAHCCVSAVDVVTFRWTGERFVKQAKKSLLSEYGKQARGKGTARTRDIR